MDTTLIGFGKMSVNAEPISQAFKQQNPCIMGFSADHEFFGQRCSLLGCTPVAKSIRLGKGFETRFPSLANSYHVYTSFLCGLSYNTYPCRWSDIYGMAYAYTSISKMFLQTRETP